MQDNIGVKGWLNIDYIHPDGTVQHIDTKNTVLTKGKQMFAQRIVSGTYAQPDPFRWIAIGIGSNTIAAADTTLGSEYLRFGTGSITGSTTTTTTTNDTARWIGSFGIDATKTLNEAGIFNKSGLDLGSMLARTCFADVNATSGGQFNLTWSIQET